MDQNSKRIASEPLPSLSTKPTRLDLLLCLFLLILAILTFYRVLSCDFLPWDDDTAITTNLHLRALTLDNLRWMFSDTHLTLRYEPLAWLLWTFIYHCAGLSASAFHLLNLTLHLANILLAFFLIRSILRWIPVQGAAPHLLAATAAIGAALWGLHPLRVEVVSWATQACFAECTCCAFITLLLYAAAVRRRPDAPYRTFHFWLSAFAFTCSLLFFSASIGIAILLPFLDILLFRRVDPRAATFRHLAKFVAEKAVFFAAALLVGFLTLQGRLQASGDVWTPPPTLIQFPLLNRIMQAAYIIIYYLWKPFDILHISPVYNMLVGFDPLSAPFVLSLLTLCLISLAALLFWRRYPTLAAFWIAHLLLILPFGGYFDYPHYPNDRYSYLQGFLLAAFCALLLVKIIVRVRLSLRPLLLAAAAAVIFLCALLSNLYSRSWHDGESFFQSILATLGHDPYRFDIDLRLGKWYADHHDLPNALELYDRVLPFAGNNPLPPYLKGLALLDVAAIAHQQNQPPALLSQIYSQAEALLDRAAALSRAVPYFTAAGDAYFQAENYPAAEVRYRVALLYSPTPALLLKHAESLYRMQKPSDALHDLDAAIRLDPTLAPRRSELLTTWQAPSIPRQPFAETSPR